MSFLKYMIHLCLRPKHILPHTLPIHFLFLSVDSACFSLQALCLLFPLEIILPIMDTISKTSSGNDAISSFHVKVKVIFLRVICHYDAQRNSAKLRNNTAPSLADYKEKDSK